MIPHQFGLRLARTVVPAVLLDHCVDAVVEFDPAASAIRAHFDRVAPSLAEAVVAAVRDVEAGGATAVTVLPDDELVTMGAVAARLAVSRRVAEALLHDGPPPLWHCGGEPVYRWGEIAPRLRVGGDSASQRTFEAANLALRLRTLTRDDAALAALARIVDG